MQRFASTRHANYYRLMTLIARQNSTVRAQIFCALGRLMAFFIVTTIVLSGIVVVQAQEYEQSHVKGSALHVEPSVRAIPSPTAQELDEVRQHGHHHSGNPLEDLVTLGHSHVGCQCASSTAEIFVLVAVPNSSLVVARKAQREHDSPPNHPFRPPIV
jgi:hypothetical protein